MGYDLANANLVQMDYEAHVTRGGRVPDVVLVRKSYEEKRRKRGRRARAWQLKRLDMEMGDDRWVGQWGGEQGGGWVCLGDERWVGFVRGSCARGSRWVSQGWVRAVGSAGGADQAVTGGNCSM